MKEELRADDLNSKPAKAMALLCRLYVQEGIAVDELPYTDHMHNISAELNEKTGGNFAEGDVYQLLIGMRKGSLLPLLGRS